MEGSGAENRTGEEVRKGPRVAIIVATLNEVDNIDPFLQRALAQSSSIGDFEILIADGGSTDGTVDRARAWESRAPVRLVPAGGRRGLAGDVLAAAAQATSEIVVVMDADFSHPPESIADLLRPVIDGRSDMAIGSRYVPGGETPGWPASRRLLSRCGSLAARPLTGVNDPLSGFFAVRRDRLLAADPRAAGFKIALEVLAAGGDALRVVEVPISFRDRVLGQSKMGAAQARAYFQRLTALGGGAVSIGNAQRFALVGLAGFALDWAAFLALTHLGADLAVAHIASFALATVCNYLLNARWTFAPVAGAPGISWRQYSRFLAVALMALFLRGGVLSLAVAAWGLPAETAIVFAIASGAVVNYIGSAFYVFGSATLMPQSVRWRVAALGVALYVLALRLAFLGSVDLLPEEAYYWNYAQHLDLGYLDHPPMVAWLIWLGTSLFGHSEFGVRLGAYLSWAVAAIFCFRTARDLYGDTAAFVAVLLLAALPFYFATGTLMTPDAPLTAAWSAALYFLERALLGGERAAWWRAGICVGLGLLSKYTIALLGPAALVFMALDARSRAWLRRPWPYVAVLTAAVLFLPVVVWNAQHEWASFAYQGPQRLQATFRFSLFHLLASILVLLTPVGAAAVFLALSRRARMPFRGPRESSDRRSLFVATFTLAPLSVFLVYSLFRQVKLDWTGPLWLAILPMLAADIVAGWQASAVRSDALRRAWAPTVLTLLLAYGAGLHYLALGLPGVGYSDDLATLPVAWEEFGEQAARIEKEIHSGSGYQPLRVGMDRYFLSSEMAFYDPVDNHGAANTAGRSLFGGDSVMYNYWFSPGPQRGKTLILFALKSEDLSGADIGAHFSELGPVREGVLYKRGARAGRYFYRIGRVFRPR